jgi:hypothetical protein
VSHWEADGQSSDWRTPKYIFDAMGAWFAVDVAAPNKGVCHVPTLERLTSGSLEAEWRGFVWMNPPFGGRNGLVPWLEKFFAHGDGVALVPDRTSAPWFQWIARRVDLILFVSPKVRFLRADGSEGVAPSTGTALLAMGKLGRRALENGESLGLLCRPNLA